MIMKEENGIGLIYPKHFSHNFLGIFPGLIKFHLYVDLESECI